MKSGIAIFLAAVILSATGAEARPCVSGNVAAVATRDVDDDATDELIVLRNGPSAIVVVAGDDCQPTAEHRFRGEAVSLSVHGTRSQTYALVVTRDPNELHVFQVREDRSLHIVNMLALSGTPAQVAVRRSSDPAMKDAIFVRYVSESFLTRFESCKQCACDESELRLFEPSAGLASGDFDRDGRADLAVVSRHSIAFLSESRVEQPDIDIEVVEAFVLPDSAGDRLVVRTAQSLLVLEGAPGELRMTHEMSLPNEIRVVGTCVTGSQSSLILASNTRLHVAEIGESPRVRATYDIFGARMATCAARGDHASLIAVTAEGVVFLDRQLNR